MDHINKTNFVGYYAGDMDPEGLLIAQRLRDRYPLFRLWRYSFDDYLKSKSQNKCSKRRLKILDYQENIIQEYINDIEKYALE